MYQVDFFGVEKQLRSAMDFIEKGNSMRVGYFHNSAFLITLNQVFWRLKQMRVGYFHNSVLLLTLKVVFWRLKQMRVASHCSSTLLPLFLFWRLK